MANERLGIIFICLAPSPAKSLAELIEDKKDILAGAGWHDGWHRQILRTRLASTLTRACKGVLRLSGARPYRCKAGRVFASRMLMRGRLLRLKRSLRRERRRLWAAQTSFFGFRLFGLSWSQARCYSLCLRTSRWQFAPRAMSSCQQIRAGLGELHIGAALVEPQPAAFNGEIDTGF